MKRRNNPLHPIRLKFWQRTYWAILLLFFLCLGAVFGIAYRVALQQSRAARIRELLNQQHYILQSLVQDAKALQARNPAALTALYRYYGMQYSDADLYFEIYSSGTVIYTSVPPHCAATGERPELTVSVGNRTYLVRWTQAGRRLFSATGIADSSNATVIVCSADMEAFYTQWEATARLFLAAGSAISTLFALALYLVLRRLYQPLAQVTLAANEQAAGNFSARAPVTRRDEFGELAASLNGMADTVEQQLCELRTVADQRQRLIEDLSHEIRTPLAAISGWAETLRGASLTEAEQADAIDTILFESNRILALSRQMLQLSVMQHDAVIAFSPVETAPLLQRVQALLAPKAAARKVTLTIAYPPAFAFLSGDAVLLESVIVNLADNAIKACTPGGCVSISTELNADLRFLIRDNGRGMSAQTLAHLGQPFYREDKSRSRREGGAGLGISLCMEIARQHGARLIYESTPGKGTLALLIFATSTQMADRTEKKEQ